MTSLNARQLNCPLCNTEFPGWVVLASQDRGPMTSDLRRLPEGDDPIPRQVNGCPGCGYTGEVSAFEEHAPDPELTVPANRSGAYFSQDELEDAQDPLIADRPPSEDGTFSGQVSRYLKPRAAEAHEDPALRYEHHAQVCRWLGDGPLREGDAWLRGAWLYSDRGEQDNERRCRARALHCYRTGVAERHWFGRREDLVVIAYLIGELHRRLGETDEAGRWFEQAVTWSSGLQSMQELVQLAERQRSDPRDIV